MRTPHIILAALLAAATTAQAAATTFDLDVVMTTPDEADVQIAQTWDAQDARPFRQSLDVLFGDGNGDLTAEEVETIARATEDDMRGQTLPIFLVDGQPVNVTDVVVSFSDAVGDVDAGPMAMDHDLAVVAGTSAAETRTVEVRPMANGTVTFTPPEGWEVTNVTGGAAWTEMGAGLAGEVVADGTVVFTLAPASLAEADATANATEDGNATAKPPTPPPEEAPVEREVVDVADDTRVEETPDVTADLPQEAGDGRRQLPAFGLLAAVGAAAAAIALARRR